MVRRYLALLISAFIALAIAAHVLPFCAAEDVITTDKNSFTLTVTIREALSGLWKVRYGEEINGESIIIQDWFEPTSVVEKDSYTFEVTFDVTLRHTGRTALWIQAMDRAWNVSGKKMIDINYAPLTLPAPVLIMPKEENVFSFTPLFEWDLPNADIAVANDVRYTLYISGDDSFSNTIYRKDGLSSTQYRLPSGVITSLGRYYWKVVATLQLQESVLESTSDTTWFDVVSSSGENLQPPIPIEPIDTIVKPNVSFRWVGTPQAKVRYIVHVSTEPDFSRRVLDKTTAETSLLATLKGTKEYYWRVSAFTVSSSSEWSSTCRFWVDDDTPRIDFISPLDNANVLVQSGSYIQVLVIDNTRIDDVSCVLKLDNGDIVVPPSGFNLEVQKKEFPNIVYVSRSMDDLGAENYILVVTAKDVVGNTTTQQIRFTVSENGLVYYEDILSSLLDFVKFSLRTDKTMYEPLSEITSTLTVKNLLDVKIAMRVSVVIENSVVPVNIILQPSETQDYESKLQAPLAVGATSVLAVAYSRVVASAPITIAQVIPPSWLWLILLIIAIVAIVAVAYYIRKKIVPRELPVEERKFEEIPIP